MKRIPDWHGENWLTSQLCEVAVKTFSLVTAGLIYGFFISRYTSWLSRGRGLQQSFYTLGYGFSVQRDIHVKRRMNA